MNDHGVSDGKHGGMIAEELMVPGAGRSGLDRRRLLGGVVAGAAGLLLPGQGASAQNKDIRFVVINHGDAWPRVKLLVRWSPSGDMWLEQGKQTTLESFRDAQLEPDLEIFAQPNSTVEHNALVYAKNPVVGPPEVDITLFHLGRGEGDPVGTHLDKGQSVTVQVPSTYRSIKVTRNDDTDDFNVFTIELTTFGKSGRVWPPPRRMQAKDDKKDKKNNNDNKRRKRGGGGGLSDVDGRERPVDRLRD